MPGFEIGVDVRIEVELAFLHQLKDAHGIQRFADRRSLEKGLRRHGDLCFLVSVTITFRPFQLVIADYADDVTPGTLWAFNLSSMFQRAGGSFSMITQLAKRLFSTLRALSLRVLGAGHEGEQ